METKDTVAFITGANKGIGLETARRARTEGAEVILTARNPERLNKAARELGARSIAAFDANDLPLLEGFFDGLPTMSWSPPAPRTTGRS